jgi:hypothetical protein
MNLTAIKLGAAIAATATAATLLGGAPAQALSLSDSRLTGVLSIDVSGLVRSVESNFVDFGSPNTVSSPGTTNLTSLAFASSTGSFGSISSGTLQDLPIFASFPSGGINDFITVSDSSGSVQFDLVKLFDEKLTGNAPGVQGVYTARLRGFFRPTDQPNASDIDILNARLTTANNKLTIELTPVPTPALVPAAIGFGAAMLRKRKEEEAGKETAEAKA